METKTLSIITPCFQDQESLDKLLTEIAKASSQNIAYDIHISIVNDSPWSPISVRSLSASITYSVSLYHNISSLKTITLNSNQGHQKALYIGLCEAYTHFGDDAHYLLMDCDGEDSPSDIHILIQECQSSSVFASVAARSKRYDSAAFKVGYLLYKKIFRLLSGAYIDFGNFMFLTPEAARCLLHSPTATSHLAASLIRTRIPFKRVYLDRGRRYKGRSKMGGSIALVGYGIKAISVFADSVMTRLLVACSLSLLIICVILVFLIINRLFPVFPPVPGWTSLLGISLILLGLIGALTTLNGLLVMPSQRLSSSQHLSDIISTHISSVESSEFLG